MLRRITVLWFIHPQFVKCCPISQISQKILISQKRIDFSNLILDEVYNKLNFLVLSQYIHENRHQMSHYSFVRKVKNISSVKPMYIYIHIYKNIKFNELGSPQNHAI